MIIIRVCGGALPEAGSVPRLLLAVAGYTLVDAEHVVGKLKLYMLAPETSMIVV